MKVSVCIPTRNQVNYLGDALRSAFSQTRLPDQVVVCDDASTDDTAGAVASFARSLPAGLASRLSCHRNPEPLGIGGNFDQAVRLGHGEFCVKLDSDDILEPRYVEILLNHLQECPKAGWAHSNITNISPDGAPLGLAHSRKGTGFYSALDLLPAYLRHNDTCHCVMIRKSAYEAAGGYRLAMKTCEDWLLWLEMILAGWGHCFDARPLARMRKYDSRPELMTKRRQDFIASARVLLRVMQQRIEGQLSLPGGVSCNAALARLRDSVARLCSSSARHEPDLATRRELFAAAHEFSPTRFRHLWATLGYRTPLPCLELGDQLAGLPRRWARYCYQKLFRA